MDVRKLWDNAEENSQYKNVCDVYGAEHLARLIGSSFTASRLQISKAFVFANILPRSLITRTPRTDEHGSAISVAPQRRDWKVHFLARAQLRNVLCQRVRDSIPRVH